MVRHAEGEREILLDEQDREPLALEILDDPADLADQEWRQALGGLVHQQELRVGHQRAGDGQHLLLATRQLARAVGAALAQARKEIQHALDRPGPTVALDGHHQILHDRQRREDPAPLRHQTEPERHGPVRGPGGDVPVLEEDLPAPWPREADDGSDEGGLAHAVPAEDAHDLAALHAQGDALQHVAVAVVGVDVAHLEHQEVPR